MARHRILFTGGTLSPTDVAWLEGHVDGPAGVRLERFGPVTAAVTPSRPDLDFMNRIHGLPESPGRGFEQMGLFRNGAWKFEEYRKI